MTTSNTKTAEVNEEIVGANAWNFCKLPNNISCPPWQNEAGSEEASVSRLVSFVSDMEWPAVREVGKLAKKKKSDGKETHRNLPIRQDDTSPTTVVCPSICPGRQRR